mmetsp:Transcript_101599/g.199301  ORF Transcript_101599/g.199301 Transcript_101599/m.199301 type:complete len:207 (+) Transcript_101599:2-622(+)
MDGGGFAFLAELHNRPPHFRGYPGVFGRGHGHDIVARALFSCGKCHSQSVGARVARDRRVLFWLRLAHSDAVECGCARKIPGLVAASARPGLLLQRSAAEHPRRHRWRRHQLLLRNLRLRLTDTLPKVGMRRGRYVLVGADSRRAQGRHALHRPGLYVVGFRQRQWVLYTPQRHQDQRRALPRRHELHGLSWSVPPRGPFLSPLPF